MSKRSKAAKFQLEWTIKFGLEVSTCNLATTEVSCLKCLFCCEFGRECDNTERKRKLTTNCKYFSSPWRSDNFTAHLNKQHPLKWSEYQALSHEQKQNFFSSNESAKVVNMRSFVQLEGNMQA